MRSVKTEAASLIDNSVNKKEALKKASLLRLSYKEGSKGRAFWSKVYKEIKKKNIQMTLREAAGHMYDELKHNRLEVVLAPSQKDKHGKIRVVVSENVPWYKELCEKYPKQRKKYTRRTKTDTAIKRSHVLKNLNMFNKKGVMFPLYGGRLLPFIKDWRDNWEEENGVPF